MAALARSYEGARLGRRTEGWVVATFALGIAVLAVVTEHLLEMALAMLGIAGLRTIEKTKAR
jgi:hypothetical protein